MFNVYTHMGKAAKSIRLYLKNIINEIYYCSANHVSVKTRSVEFSMQQPKCFQTWVATITISTSLYHIGSSTVWVQR